MYVLWISYGGFIEGNSSMKKAYGVVMERICSVSSLRFGTIYEINSSSNKGLRDFLRRK
jgi:hypothetical protein